MSISEKTEISQNTIAYLRKLGFQRISFEEKINIGKHLTETVDLIVFDNENRPYIVVEIKSDLPTSLSKFHPTVGQAFSYVEVLDAKYLLITDSKKKFWYEVIVDKGGKHLSPINIPPSLSISTIDQTNLNVAFKTPEDLNALIWGLHDELGKLFNKGATSNLIAELIYAKLLDEELADETGNYQFQIFPEEAAEQTKSRIVNLLNQDLVEKSESLFEATALSHLDSDLLQSLVLKLQPFRLRGTGNTAVAGIKFSDLLSAEGLSDKKASTGQHFTPRIIVDAVTSMFDFSNCKTILDPAAGTGGFLIAANEQYRHLYPDARDVEIPKFVGFEINHSAAVLARMNLGLYGSTDFKIFERNFLTEDVFSDKEQFDLVISNPPFYSKLQLNANIKLPDELSESSIKRNTEALYLIKIISALNSGKFAAVIVSDGILANAQYKDFRAYILSQCYIRAVISLSDRTFVPFAAVKASILILQKKEDGIENSPTLMMRVNDINTSSKDEVLSQNDLNIAVKTYKNFVDRGELYEEGRLKLNAILVNEIIEKNGYRLDFSAYNSEYFQYMERLERGPYELSRLGDIAKIRIGKHVRRIEEGIPLISASNVSDSGLNLEPQKYAFLSPILDKDYIQSGDLIIAGVGSKFPVAIVPESFPKAIADATLNIISVKKDSNIYPEYLLSVFRHEMVKIQLDYLSVGASVRRVNPSLLKEIRIPIPPLSEQHEIAEKIKNAERIIAMAKIELEAAQNIVSKALSLE